MNLINNNFYNKSRKELVFNTSRNNNDIICQALDIVKFHKYRQTKKVFIPNQRHIPI